MNEEAKPGDVTAQGNAIQFCSFCYVSARRPIKQAVFVFAGYSVCELEEHIDAIGDDIHETIMGARRVEDA